MGPELTTVVTAGGAFEAASGACAVDAEGTAHAFVAFSTSEPVIRYARCVDGVWSVSDTGCRGQVLAATVDGPRPVLLLGNQEGVHVTTWDAAGTETRVRVADPTAFVGAGSIGASNGRWWAVWIGAAGIAEPFLLYQASTMVSGAPLQRTRITTGLSGAQQYSRPTLALDPVDPDRAALAFAVTTAAGPVLVRFGRARLADARWREEPWAPTRPTPGRDVGSPWLSATAGRIHGAYDDNGVITYAADPPKLGTHRFRFEGSGPQLAHVGGRTLVAWTGADKEFFCSQVAVGEVGVGEQVLSSTGEDVRDELMGIVAVGTRAIVLAFDYPGERLWARDV